MREAEIRQFQEQLRALQRRQRRERSSSDGLTQTAVRVVGSIARNANGSQPGQLSDELGLTSSNVAAALRELESRGFITRSKDDRDSRRVIIRLTPAGSEVVASSRTERDGWLSRAMDAVLDENEQTLLLQAGVLLERLSRFDGTAKAADVLAS